jgi:hypothetical protein
MTLRRWMLVALGGVALVWVLGGEWVSISRGVQESHLLDAMVGLSFFGAGIVALARQRDRLADGRLRSRRVSRQLG